MSSDQRGPIPVFWAQLPRITSPVGVRHKLQLLGYPPRGGKTLF